MKMFENDVVSDKRMELDEFWELVKKIDWPNRGYKDLGLTPYEIKGGDDWEKRLRDILQGVLRAKSYVDTGSPYDWPQCSDDSFLDWTSHIVGLGKDVYLKVLKNPEAINEYANEYEECFAYCFSNNRIKDFKTFIKK